MCNKNQFNFKHRPWTLTEHNSLIWSNLYHDILWIIRKLSHFLIHAHSTTHYTSWVMAHRTQHTSKSVMLPWSFLDYYHLCLAKMFHNLFVRFILVTLSCIPVKKSVQIFKNRAIGWIFKIWCVSWLFKHKKSESINKHLPVVSKLSVHRFHHILRWLPIRELFAVARACIGFQPNVSHIFYGKSRPNSSDKINFECSYLMRIIDIMHVYCNFLGDNSKWSWRIQLHRGKMRKQIKMPLCNLDANDIKCIGEIKGILNRVGHLYGHLWRFYRNVRRLSVQTKLWILEITGLFARVKGLSISNWNSFVQSEWRKLTNVGDVN